jgi:nucleoid DNA-binding protein
VAEPKTQKNTANVTDFLAAVADPKRRADAEAVTALMAEVTGATPTMWGTSIVGFGSYRYRYGSGREGEWPAVGLSPRKASLTVYVSAGFDGYDDLLARLGPHSTGKSCLYIKRLSDVDEGVLRELVAGGFRQLDGTTVTT